MRTVGVVAGSFDPPTNGHAWLFSEAARLVDELHVVIGVNSNKKYHFSDEERYDLVQAVLADLDLKGTPTQLHFSKKDLLIQVAGRVGATHLIRGIRTAEDAPAETKWATFNHRINPSVQTLCLMSPPGLSDLSSSMVNGLVGFTDWEHILAPDVHPKVLEALKKKLEQAA